MAVAFDAASESHTGTTGSTSEASFSWTHTPVGTPKGVIVFVNTVADADYITSVTYGGTTMTQVSEAADTAGEPGRVTCFHLGASVPTGAQTVQVTRTNNGTIMYAVCATVTAGSSETDTTGAVLIQNQGSYSEQNVDDGSPGENSVRFAGGYTGRGSPPPVGANSTLMHNIDFGSVGFSSCYETTAGQGSRPVGLNNTGNDDRAGVHIAVIESGATTYDDTGSGTITASGDGTPEKVSDLAGSGTITAGGDGTPELVIDLAGSGTGTLSGAATDGQVHAAVGSGTITAGGAASDTGVWNEAGSGTGTLSGDAGVELVIDLAGSGEGVLSGAAVDSLSFDEVGSGAITGSGAAVDAHVMLETGSGEVTGSGAATDTHEMTGSGSGTITAGGDATPELVITLAGSGTGILSGAAVDEHITGGTTYDETGSGTVTAGGDGTPELVITLAGSGEVTGGGAAVDSQDMVEAGSGEITGGGAATDTGTWNETGSGTITASGAAIDAMVYTETGSGTIVASGAATSGHCRPETLSPDASGNTANFSSSSASDVDDDPDSPDGLWWTASGGLTAGLVSFPSPSGDFCLGDDLQEFRILLRTDGAEQDTTFRVDLYEGDPTPVFVATIASGLSCTSSTGEVFSVTWNASLLAGVDEEASVRFVSTAGDIDMTLGAVEFNLLYDVGGPATYNETGSGTITAGDGATDAQDHVEAGTGTITAGGAAVDAQVFLETGSGTGVLGGAAVDEHLGLAVGGVCYAFGTMGPACSTGVMGVPCEVGTLDAGGEACGDMGPEETTGTFC